MSKITDTTDYLILILQAIVDNRKTAKEVLEMTPEQREEWKAKLVAEEKAEIERGKELLANSEPPA